ncbi:MAG: pectinesterase family protein [Lachnospiraceae bacterium]
MSHIYHIRQDGGGDFKSVSDALAAVQTRDETDPEHAKSPVTLMIYNGIYKERISIVRPYLTLIGQSPEDTILTYDLYADMPMPDIGKLGTFRSYSLIIDTHDVTFCNLTFANSSGSGPAVGQAIAVYADGDRLSFGGCRFLGGQDTLFTAPLPPKEVEPNGFIGPKQFAPRITGRHYYKSCYIEGDIDFIFGGATAYFEDCELFSKDIGQDINSYVTAASTPEHQPYGYVMQSCRFTGNCPRHSAYLGRPWREYAKTVLLDCHIGSHICAAGWHDWNKSEAHSTILYAEYQNRGPSSDIAKRPHWVKQLTPAKAAFYTRELVLSGPDQWQPVSFEKLMFVILE